MRKALIYMFTKSGDPRRKTFALRIDLNDLNSLTGIAEEEKRPYSQVAVLLLHSALVGYKKNRRGASILEYCRRLEADFSNEPPRRNTSTVTILPTPSVKKVGE